MKESQKLAEILGEFVHQSCEKVAAGSGTGSIFTLRFNDGHSIMIWSTWYLKRNELLVCDSESNNEPGGPMIMGLEQLIDKKVESIEVKQTTGHLTMSFEDGYRLEILADAKKIYKDEESVNYTIFLSDVSYSLTAELELSEER